MPRFFKPISTTDFSEKIDSFGNSDSERVEALEKDIKVSFDLENITSSEADFGPGSLMGLHEEENGLTYHGFAAGGDWEHPVFFMIYWDGKNLRGYVPTEGNPWNRITKEAYGNDEEKDLEDIKKRWPEKSDVEDLSFDFEAIRADFMKRLVPKS